MKKGDKIILQNYKHQWYNGCKAIITEIKGENVICIIMGGEYQGRRLLISEKHIV
mgnify:CR=1 FL=1